MRNGWLMVLICGGVMVTAFAAMVSRDAFAEDCKSVSERIVTENWPDCVEQTIVRHDPCWGTGQYYVHTAYITNNCDKRLKFKARKDGKADKTWELEPGEYSDDSWRCVQAVGDIYLCKETNGPVTR